MSVTKDQVVAGVQAVVAVGQAIREFGPQGVPSGHLYAALMSKLDISQYDRIIGILVKNGIVRKSGEILTSLV